MNHFRFQLGTLVILVLVLGVGFAALRESNEIWDSIIFSVTIGVLLISILFAVHRAESKQAFWIGFALFGSTYLGFSLVPSIEPRLITTKVLAYLDSKVPRWSPASDALYDLLVVNNSQPIVFSPNKGNGNVTDVSVVAGSKPWFPDILAGPSLTGSSGTTENFVRIGHSLLALIAAFAGGLLSRHLYGENHQAVRELVNPLGSHSTGSGDRADVCS